MRKSTVMPTATTRRLRHQRQRRRTMFVGASRIAVSFRPVIPPRVAPQQSPRPLRRFGYYSVSAHFGTRNASASPRYSRRGRKRSKWPKLRLTTKAPYKGWGEGGQSLDGPEPPHPNPLPGGERGQTETAACSAIASPIATFLISPLK